MHIKQFYGIVAAAAIAAVLSFGGTAFAAQSVDDDANLSVGTVQTAAKANAELAKVQKKFPKATVVEAKGAGLKSALENAGSKATAKKPVIVHAKGSISIANATVPANVILVGEKTTTYTYNGPAGATWIFNMKGSIFGGKFNGGKCYWSVLYDRAKGSAINGFVEDIVVTSGKCYGIGEQNGSTKLRVKNCKISNVKDCGIHVISSNATWIKNCTIYNVGESGIDISHANVGTISGNKVTKGLGHGISTDSEVYKEYNLGFGACHIGTIANNTISGFRYHGIYFEDKCTAKAVKSNKVFNNGGVGLNVVTGAVVKGVANNQFYGNTHSNVTASGKLATIAFTSGNKLYLSKGNGLNVSAGGRVTISGSKNQIYSNAVNGINLTDAGSLLTVTGKGTIVKLNKNNGLSINTKSKASIKYMTFSGNKKLAVYVMRGSSCAYSGCNISPKSGSANRIYFA